MLYLREAAVHEMKIILALLKSKSFWINLAIALVILLAGVLFLKWYIDRYTNHDELIEVPDLEGFHFSEIDEYLSGMDLRHVIIDSIYDPAIPGGVVIDQDPPAGSKVKPKRKIYLTINAVEPPKVQLPELRGYTLRQAMIKINSYGLEVDTVIFKPAECSNCIIDVLYAGQEVRSGLLVKKGEKISLVVGAGEGTEEVPLPLFTGKTMEKVKRELNTLGLLQGYVEYDETVVSSEDSANAFVYRQVPAFRKDRTVKMGRSVDLFFTLDSNKIDEMELNWQDTNAIDTTGFDE